ncbi:MAG: NAD(P)-binding domain-containing protein [Ginsengibacter sp.]
MAVKKTIAIVGATEKAGAQIVKRFSCTPYRLLLVSDNAEQLSRLFEDISKQNPTAEIDTVECVKDGCWEADIIILAVDRCDEKHTAEMMKEVATQKIVVALSNAELEQLLPYSKVVSILDISAGEIIISGKDVTVNEEIVKIFNQAGYQVRTIGKQVNQQG